jgi:hypothetical protein
MKAQIGDRLVVKGHTVGEAERHGEVIEVHGEDGSPPFLVKWDNGHEGLVFPGSDMTVEHVEN